MKIVTYTSSGGFTGTVSGEQRPGELDTDYSARLLTAVPTGSTNPQVMDIGSYIPPTITTQQNAISQLLMNDGLIFRALEVLIDVLLTKGTIVATDFPPAIRTLYTARKAIRATAGVP